ncbi:putative short chain dehydrogenase/reductase [Longimycelium tulufanense]|uniref:Putative short chain dehydrogenase/reductase n=1 Tax=Longimycelium tulufanense TaxID=907463 RepID=A0A8J3CHU2_9PSEU|nr:SDR family NAD(P)-dependent oxidoreductase [Longimycelium tulufanense]GGM69631.1 putative short chain dehydrogenase/reductase [Longimycelium tulufanense]
MSAEQTIHESPSGRVAVVTGASAGIGAATARRLATEGFRVILGARRVERCREIADEIGGTALALDVTDPESVAAFCAAVPTAHVLVNNAGGALGLAPVAQADEEHWRRMWESNVLGTLQMTKALIGRLADSGDGHVVTVTSVAALHIYDNGAGYTSAKHAQSVLHQTLRGEHLGEPVRFTEICPGLVETEFSLVRFEGDQERAASVYQGMTPLTAEDVADTIAWAVTRPSHVNIDRIVLMPRDQASPTRVHRR